MTSLNIKGNDQDVAVIIEGDIVRYKIANIVDEREIGRLINIGLRVVNENITSLVLIDLSRVDKFSLGMRTGWIQFLKNPRIKKVAVFGGNQFIKTAVSFVVKAAHADNTRLFVNEEDALDWLRS